MSNFEAQSSNLIKIILEDWNVGMIESCVRVKMLYSQPDLPMFHHSILPWSFFIWHSFAICQPAVASA